MSSGPDDNALLRGYLLSTMPEEERLDLAARYFSDDALFERLKAAEADLIDDYVRGELSEEDRRLFEQTLEAFPGRAQRVVFARALSRLPSEPVAFVRPPRSRGGWLVAAALLLLGIGGLFFAQRDRRELDQVRSDLERLSQQERRLQIENRELRSQLEELRRSAGRTGTALQSVVSLVLSAGLQREGPGSSRLEIPAEAQTVRLILPFESREGARYQVRIERPDGSEFARREASSVFPNPGGPGLTIELPAMTLPSGDYVVLVEEVSGTAPEAVQEYTFRVLRP